MKELFKGVAQRGAFRLVGLAAVCVGLGFLTNAGFVLLVAAYDQVIASIMFAWDTLPSEHC